MAWRQSFLVGLLWLQSGLIRPLEGNPNHGHAEYKAFLQHHSFAVPLEYSSLLSDWTLSGASIFERERLLLHPGVVDRQGFAWNKRPLQTNNFEASFSFRAAGSADLSKVVDDQSFAFWFVRQNISADFNESAAIRASSWLEGLKEQGYMLSGSKALFEGVGAVFSTANLAKKPGSVVSFISNDNHQSLAYGIDVPTSSAKAVDFRNKDVEFKFRVQPFSVKGHIIVDGKSEECFNVDRKNFPVKAGGYIGFTGWSGSGPAKIADAVSLTKVQVVNFDDQAVGEDVVGANAKDKAAYEALMSEDSRYFQDQQAQTEHIARITAMLSAHLNETKPSYDVMSFQVSTLLESLHKLDRDCRVLTKEMQFLAAEPKNAKQPPKKSSNLQEMKVHIMGLRRLLDKEGAAHMHKLEAVQKNLNEVKEKADQGAGQTILSKIVTQSMVLEQSVVSRSSQMSWMLVVLLAVTVVIGVLMWNRMRYYEKKHFI